MSTTIKLNTTVSKNLTDSVNDKVQKYFMTGDKEYLKDIIRERKKFVEGNSRVIIEHLSTLEEKVRYCFNKKDRYIKHLLQQAFNTRYRVIQDDTSTKIEIKEQLLKNMLEYGLKVVKNVNKRSKSYGEYGISIGIYHSVHGYSVRVINTNTYQMSTWTISSVEVVESIFKYVTREFQSNELGNEFYVNGLLDFKSVLKFIQHNRRTLNNHQIGNIAYYDRRKAIIIDSHKDDMTLLFIPEDMNTVYTGDEYVKFVNKNDSLFTQSYISAMIELYKDTNIFEHMRSITGNYLYRLILTNQIEEDHLRNTIKSNNGVLYLKRLDKGDTLIITDFIVKHDAEKDYLTVHAKTLDGVTVSTYNTSISTIRS